MLNMPLILYLLLFNLSGTDQDSIPFKPAEEFEFELKLELRPKPGLEEEPDVGHIIYKMKSDNASVIEANKQTYDPTTLAYASMSIKPLKLSDDEERVRVADNLGNRLYNRKATLEDRIEFEMGFVDDLKDHISPYQFEVIFFTKRREVSRVFVYSDKDGNLIINEEIRDKF